MAKDKQGEGKPSRIYNEVLNVTVPFHALALKKLVDVPLKEGEVAYISPRKQVVGDGLEFEAIAVIEQGLGRNIGGFYRTDKPEEIALLDRLCQTHSGDFIKAAGE